MFLDVDPPIEALMNRRWSASTWNPALLHVKDLSLCERAVWARRNGLMSPRPAIEKFIKRETRLAYERMLCDAFEEEGKTYEYRRAIETVLFGVPIVGTATFVLPDEDAVLEIRSTTFWTGWVGKGAQKRKTVRAPESPRLGYRLVSAAYALALGRKRYGIHTFCRNTGLRTTATYEARDLAPDVGRALVERTRTEPGMPENTRALPPSFTYSGDGISRQCQNCAYLACENNRNESLKGVK